MTKLIQAYGITLSTLFGLFWIVWAFVSAGESFLISGGIFLGAAMISAQLAKLAERGND